MQAQYKFIHQNDTTIPNWLEKPQKKTQNNACIGFAITNWKSTNVQKVGFLPKKIGCRALTGGKALTPILNT